MSPLEKNQGSQRPPLHRGTSAEWAAATGRQCGQCSLCCKLLHVKELDKPANQWCQHARPGKGGCTIWGATPDICKTYFCGWRLTRAFGDEWFPARAHMVVSLNRLNGIQVLMVTVDPAYPDAWKRQPYHAQLRERARRGLSASDYMVVIVRCGDKSWLILPDNDKEIPPGAAIVPPRRIRERARPPIVDKPIST